MISTRTLFRLFPLAIISLGIFLNGCRKEQEPGTEAPLEYLVKDGVQIVQDPNGRAPLSAVANFKTFDGCKVHVKVNGETPIEYDVNIYHKDHHTPIIGLYHNAVNSVEMTIIDQEGVYATKKFEITIGHLDERLPTVEVNHEAGNVEPGVTFCDLHLANNGVFATNFIAVDDKGKIRWHLDLTGYGQITWPLQRFSNGNLFVANANGIYELDMLGNEVSHWSLGGYRPHHDMIELPNGNLLLAVQKYGTTVETPNGTSESTDDHIIEFNRGSGSIVDEWDLREVLDVDRYDLTNDPVDWFHMNAIWYSASDDCIIVSGRNQGLAKIDRNNGLKWILAPHQGWGLAGANGQGLNTADYLLTAVDASGTPLSQGVQEGTEASSEFDWCWGQHAPMLLDNGNIMLFDNGYNRQFGSANSYSRAVEYSVNQNDKTVKQVWQWGTDRGLDFFSSIISDVDVLPETGNRLITAGFIRATGVPQAKVVEISHPMDMEEFEFTLYFKDVNVSGSGWGNADILYRSERMPLYPN